MGDGLYCTLYSSSWKMHTWHLKTQTLGCIAKSNHTGEGKKYQSNIFVLVPPKMVCCGTTAQNGVLALLDCFCFAVPSGVLQKRRKTG